MYTDDERDLITLAYLDGLSYHAKHAMLSRLESSKPDFDKYESILIKTLPFTAFIIK
ncbi:MAG: hypothetical protein K2O41_04685 [Clostridia bacterium]|nr:hypothetical protein [Clostridia bacterium]